MKKITWVLLIATLILSCFCSQAVFAAQRDVTVNIPTFDVTLNGLKIDNSTNQYPLIVYKNITYFPMTYYDSRFLGLESQWDKNTGLTIVKTGANWEYYKYPSPVKNAGSYTAQIAPFQVTVNGRKIDNSNEEYPLLVFRGVTYFPLTWRFAVDEFGWEYSFDQNNGLVINADSGLVAVGLTLPVATLSNGAIGALTMAGDYLYYQGSQGKIYQAPVSDTSAARPIYQLPIDGYTEDWIVFASLQNVNGKAYLKYHTGGATMGSDHLIWLKEDGTSEKIDSGYFARKEYDNYTIRVDQWVPPFPNNLQVKKTGEKSYQTVGNPDYLYGWIIRPDQSGSPSDDLCLIGEDIYLLGYLRSDNQQSTTGIYRVNINTNATERVCETPASGFKIVDDIIYFVDLNNYLYQVPIQGGAAVRLTDVAVGEYEVLNGKIYYTSPARDNELFILGRDDSINPGGQVKNLEIQEGNLVATFHKEGKSPYKMLIINKDGNVIYKTTENVLLARLENDKVVFIKED
ncbi:DUF5050 domain-containing protein [Desulforamulus ferrireducens]|uniref:Prolow-density lipoprotein receptor-related protein 1-like beta-propeller domain-containing protein n=1 Tax=Desulforamulus ferrireducens TaxID=1833852 RepID=A0A1S6IV30_9FIRM|nr:DUF5050 domain-containing protein [Desulforamulus ferrireducens]AQS58631.1 hypothetical protein B0537_05750 [Desulforamulus ferrireducens]